MTLKQKDIEKIAHLARITLDNVAIPHYVNDLNNIFNLVEQLNTVSTDQISPMAHPLDAQQRLRPDIVTETDQREQFQKIAPKTENGVYLVPKVID